MGWHSQEVSDNLQHENAVSEICMIPTEPIGSITRPLRLMEAIANSDTPSEILDGLSRETAFAKIRARERGTELASDILGGR